MDNNTRCKRLIYRSAHRGCKETDLVLGHFARTQLAGLPLPLLDAFERLMDENDADIWAWLTAKEPSKKTYAALIDMMQKQAIAS